MKKLILPQFLFLTILISTLSGCYSSRVVTGPPPPPVVVEKNPSHLPPGQAKKIYGEKSAKDFAPGHQRKQEYASYPLIVVYSTGMKIIINGGRRCYRNNDDIIYWEGSDGRFYIDDGYLPQQYDKKEYDEWKKNKGQSKGNKGKEKHKGEGNGKWKEGEDDDR